MAEELSGAEVLREETESMQQRGAEAAVNIEEWDEAPDNIQP